MPIGKAVTIAIDAAILQRVDAIQPTHLTRKPFINQLLLEAVEAHELKRARQSSVTAE